MPLALKPPDQVVAVGLLFPEPGQFAGQSLLVLAVRYRRLRAPAVEGVGKAVGPAWLVLVIHLNTAVITNGGIRIVDVDRFVARQVEICSPVGHVPALS